MNLEKIREYCLSLPHVTEEVLWEKDLVDSYEMVKVHLSEIQLTTMHAD
jgi:predicted DNA-binding protein (MmcQ/YjbR family)